VIKTPVPQPLEIDRGAFSATFGRMVEDDIQDDADSRLVKALHQVAKFLAMGSFLL